MIIKPTSVLSLLALCNIIYGDIITTTTTSSTPLDKVDNKTNDNNNLQEENSRSLYELFEGDIIPDYNTIAKQYGVDVAQQLVAEGAIDDPPPSASNNVDVYTGKGPQRSIAPETRWTTRVEDVVQIPYLIDSSFSNNQRSKIETAVDQLSKRSGVVNFVTRTNENDFLYISPGNGCSSYIGRQGGSQLIVLDDWCVESKGTIQHEFMHALGIFHEQSRPDRDDYVNILWSNIDGGTSNYNFEKQQNTETLGNGYDYGSVMHYHPYSFSKNGKVTITPKQNMQGKQMGQRVQADFQDILDIRLLYQCASGTRSVNQYYTNKCTSDCKCWENFKGCKGNDNACQGSLVCSDDKCVQDEGREIGGGTGGGTGGNTGGGTGGGTGGSTGDEKLIKIGNKCMTVFRRQGNKVVAKDCNGWDNQKWLYDSNTKAIKSMIKGENLCLHWVVRRMDVVVRPCIGSKNQQWFLQETASGDTMMIRRMNQRGHCAALNPNTSKILLQNKGACFYQLNQRFYFSTWSK